MPISRARLAAFALPPLLAIGIGGAIFAEHMKEEQDRRTRAEEMSSGEPHV